MERRHAAGNATDLERAEEDASLAEARLDLNRDELELVERRERLNQLLGLSGAASAWTVREPLAEPMAAEPTLATLEAAALKRRLDVAAAGSQAVLLGKATALARSTRAIGRLDVGVDAHQDPDGPRVIGPNLVIELPLFDQRQATIARLVASQREAERHHERVVGDVRAEVRVAHARTAAAREVVMHYHDTLLPLRRSVVELTQEAFNGMLIGASRLLEAKRAELDAHRGYLAALGAYWGARAELERATASRLDANTNAPLATAATDGKGGGQ
jgi:cobalt-zinc-cadmium efflux system outer membrane protein